MVSTANPVGRPFPGRARSKDKARMGETRGFFSEVGEIKSNREGCSFNLSRLAGEAAMLTRDPYL